ncbi:MAG: SDR family oxidoreductase [Candidatus Kapabacteria bacterium]|nr:SDR family oxidoreductase [Candidatus Kapabacteria bacterium]
MARVLVLGGGGFLGSHLCERFLNEGDEVVCMDNFISSSPDNIAHLLENKKFHFIFQDVTNFIYLEGKVDYILHFASPASPPVYYKYPIQTLKVGALGTHKALGLAKAKNARFLFASTSEIYGDPAIHPQPESYWGNVNTIGMRGVYDEAKRFGEAMAMAYHRFHGVETRIVRIFNTYGPRMQANDGRAIPAFINQALKNEDITVFGDGSQTRSLCYVDDLVDGIYRLLMSNEAEPVNIGNPDELTMLELAKQIIELTGSQSKIIFQELPEDDPKLRRPDITRARSILGWEPKVDRKPGLIKTIDYFKSKL